MNPASQPRWRILFEPMMIAAQITWLAVFIATVTSKTTSLLPLTASQALALAVASLLVFLLLMLFSALYEDRISKGLRLILLAVLVVATLIVCALSTSNIGQILLIIVMSELAGLLTRPQLIGAFAAANTAMLVVHAQRWGLGNAAVGALAFAGFQLFAIMMTTYARRAEEASAELRQVNAHLLATRTLLAESARDQERLRISRELHDVSGHKLTAMKLHLLALQRDPRLQHVSEIETCGQLADELLGDIREVVKQMRVHDGMNLHAAIEQIAQAMPTPRAHIDVAADAGVGNALQAEALLRAVQEAITNAARHGAADNIWIVLRRVAGRIELDVRDDGRGSRDIRFGNGLSGMRERIEGLGGAIAPIVNPGRGFVLQAWIPVS